MKTLSRSALFASLVLVMATGCATTPRTPVAPPTDSFVRGEMSQAIASVEQNLEVLVAIERGDEAERRSTALGLTVAGAAGPDQAPLAVDEVAGPDTELGRARIEAAQEEARALLHTRVRLTWTGHADQLLSELAMAIGYTSHKHGDRVSPVVTVEFDDATISDVLTEIGRQTETVGEIRVDLTDRTINYHTR